MKNKEIFDKAYERLRELYLGYSHSLDVRLLNRFYQEKMILEESELYLRYLEFIGRMKNKAESIGEHVSARGTAGASLIAFLLGATDVNPLPRHEYCPNCRRIHFTGEGVPYGGLATKCSCDSEMIIDGFDIPFESVLKSVEREHITLGVSEAFFDNAKRMIYDEMWDKAIVTLRNEEKSTTWFCFLDREENDNGEYALDGNSELFSECPRITLMPLAILDRFKELEVATGFKMGDVGRFESDFVFPFMMDGAFDGIFNLDNVFVRDVLATTSPRSYDDIFKIIGFAHSTGVWRENGEILFDDRKMSLREIPAYREELYGMICEKLRKKGMYETGFAYEVTEKARRGYYNSKGGVDEDTELCLLDIGFDSDFIFLLERVEYMFTKAHGALYLREAIALMFYKFNFSKEFNEIILAKQKT